jgi:protease-4
VDRIGYQDELVDLLNGDDETRPVPLYDIAFYNEGLKSDPFHTLSEKIAANKARDKAAQKAKANTAPADTIAVIYASGAIVQGDVRDVTAPGAALGGNPTISAERMVHAMTAARGNPRVGTILLRIDSPGGSATASETIARALERAQADGKSVVVSMSGSAASGGYWIAAKTDRIFALPATMTGSIGVLGGKVSVGGLLDKVDANIVEYNYGRNAGLWSSTSTFTPSERAQVDKLLDNTYEAFLARVSEGRGIPVTTLRNEIAGGRVWTGAEALQIGLVDELGGMAEAVAYSKSLMMPETPDAVRLQEYPPRKSQLEMLADLLVNGVSMDDPMGRIQKALTLKAREAAQEASRMDVYTNLPEFE